MKNFFKLLICFLIAFETLFINIASADEILEDEPFISTFVDSDDNSLSPQIGAEAAIVMDIETGRVLYGKNPYSIRPMASTTKIMTAIVALENGNLDEIVVVSKNAASIWGSNINLKAGQEISLKELLYGLMLNSGNDAAIAIAEHIGGTVEHFAEMMTDKAKKLGAFDTSFKSPHGLDMDEHFTTPYDLALITSYALKNRDFSEIVSTKEVNIGYRSLRNTNEMLYIYPGADGVKTGFTGKAGRCLVTSATRDGWRLVSVALGCATRTVRAESSKAILDYAFANYKPYTLVNEGEILKTVEVVKGIENYLAVKAIDEVIVPLKKEELDGIQIIFDLPDKLKTPIFEGVEVGTVYCYLNGEIIGRSGLKADTSIRRKEFLDYLGMIFTKWVRLAHEGIF